MLVKIGEVAKHFGVTTQAIRDWTAKGKIKCTITPTGTRMYDIDNLFPESKPNEDYRVVIYCRVSSRKQKEDLERQISKAEELFPEAEIISEIGSGLNWKRKEFRKLIRRATRREFQEIKVFHRDRLCRFGFEIFEFIFSLHEIKLSVIEGDCFKTREQEFAEDLLAITHHFSCAMYGRRKYACDEIKDNKDRKSSSENSENDDGIISEDL